MHPGGPEQIRPSRRGRGLLLTVLAVLAVVVALLLWLAIRAADPQSRAGTAVLPADILQDRLLDQSELADLFGEPFAADSDRTVGGRADMPAENHADKYTDAGSADCIGVARLAQWPGYRTAAVEEFVSDRRLAQEDRSDQRIRAVEQSIVALPSAEDAQQVFTGLTGGWAACNGQTVVHKPGRIVKNFYLSISDARVADGVAAATVLSGTNAYLDKAPIARAVTVVDNYIVETEVLFFPGEATGDEGVAGVSTSGIELAEAVAARLR